MPKRTGSLLSVCFARAWLPGTVSSKSSARRGTCCAAVFHLIRWIVPCHRPCETGCLAYLWEGYNNSSSCGPPEHRVLANERERHQAEGVWLSFSCRYEDEAMSFSVLRVENDSSNCGRCCWGAKRTARTYQNRATTNCRCHDGCVRFAPKREMPIQPFKQSPLTRTNSALLLTLADKTRWIRA